MIWIGSARIGTSKAIRGNAWRSAKGAAKVSRRFACTKALWHLTTRTRSTIAFGTTTTRSCSSKSPEKWPNCFPGAWPTSTIPGVTPWSTFSEAATATSKLLWPARFRPVCNEGWIKTFLLVTVRKSSLKVYFLFGNKVQKSFRIRIRLRKQIRSSHKKLKSGRNIQSESRNFMFHAPLVDINAFFWLRGENVYQRSHSRIPQGLSVNSGRGFRRRTSPLVYSNRRTWHGTWKKALVKFHGQE